VFDTCLFDTCLPEVCLCDVSVCAVCMCDCGCMNVCVCTCSCVLTDCNPSGFSQHSATSSVLSSIVPATSSSNTWTLCSIKLSNSTLSPACANVTVSIEWYGMNLVPWCVCMWSMCLRLGSVCMCMYVYAGLFIHTQAYRHTYIHVSANIHIHAYTHIHTYTCIHTHTYIHSTYIYIHTYTYIYA